MMLGRPTVPRPEWNSEKHVPDQPKGAEQSLYELAEI